MNPKLIALALAASSVLSGCGIMGSASNEQTSASNEQNASAAENEGSTQAGENEITDLVLTHLASTEISTFNLLNSQSQMDVQYLTNMVDGLGRRQRRRKSEMYCSGFPDRYGVDPQLP